VAAPPFKTVIFSLLRSTPVVFVLFGLAE
jgi:hypothetical protein